MPQRQWKCSVCGYVHFGDSPPFECPQCSSSSREYSLFREKERLEYDGRKFDVLLINGSSHRAHNSGLLTDIAEAELRKRKVSYRRFNLNELDIQHCWCCYSMYDAACTYPCRNQLDDAPALHQMVIDSKAVIIVSPINWNNMSARLKDFLDRLTCIQNLYLLKKKGQTTGKLFGVIIDGHEDGAAKTAMDIFFYFQQLGYIMVPFGFGYRTHGAIYNARADHKFFKYDKKIKDEIRGVVNNTVETMKLGIEKKLGPRIKPVSE